MSFYDNRPDSSNPSIPFARNSSSKKYIGKIEAINDERQQGRAQVRIINVHPASKIKLPTADLAWLPTNLPLGAGGGMGESVNYLVDQFVYVRPTKNSQTEWEIIGNAPMMAEPTTEDGSYGDVSPEDEKRVSNLDIFNGFVTGNLEKLEGTIMGILNAGILEMFTGLFAGDPSPELIPQAGDLVATDLDWRDIYSKVCTRFGGNKGSCLASARYETIWTCDDPENPGQDLDTSVFSSCRRTSCNTELINCRRDGTIPVPGDSDYPATCPGNVIGYDSNGNVQYCTLDSNGSLICPTNVQNLGDYTLLCKTTDVSNSNNNCTAKIQIRCVDLPADISAPREMMTNWTLNSSTATPRGIFGDIDITIEEPLNFQDRTVYPYCKVWANSSITEIKDATEDNSTWAVYHSRVAKVGSEQPDPEDISRLEINKDGDIIVRSANDLMLISKKNLALYVEGIVQAQVKDKILLHCPDVTIVGDLNIDGIITTPFPIIAPNV